MVCVLAYFAAAAWNAWGWLTTLRTRLKALVEEWRKESGYTNITPAEAGILTSNARELAALLAESETAEDAKRIVDQAMHGAKVPPGYQQAKPVLKLGHEFFAYDNSSESCQVYIAGRGFCGQPRSAHEPK